MITAIVILGTKRNEVKEWYSEAEAAEWMNVPVQDVRDAVRRGDLPALKLGGATRLSRSALVALAGGPSTGESGLAPPLLDAGRAPVASDGRLPVPAGFRWLTPLAPAEPFEHRWPKKRKAGPDGKPVAGSGSSVEKYPRAWAGSAKLNGAAVAVLVGEATGEQRHDGKRRLTVKFDGYPTAEFLPTADGARWASLIKPDGRHTADPSNPLPCLYRFAVVEPYQETTGMRGPGRPTGPAVVIAVDDIESAVHHAAARWLGRYGHALEPDLTPA